MRRRRVKKVEDKIVKKYSPGLFPKSRLNKELSVYSSLKNKDVLTPKSYGDDQGNLILEFVSSREINKKDYTSIVKLLLDFQFSEIKLKDSFFLKIYDNIYFRKFLFMFLFIYKSGFKFFFKSIFYSLNSFFSQKKFNKKILLHNDFNLTQVLVNNEGTFLIDFEAPVYTNKWILGDILDACFDIEKLSFNKILFNKYLRELKKREEKIYENINLDSQIRFFLIRRFVKYLAKNKLSLKQSLFFFKCLKNPSELI